MTARDIITDALREIGVLNAVDPPSGEDAELGLFRLNKLLDNLNAERTGVYADVIESFTLVPATQPHTIGPTAATWTTTQRPESIEAANLVVSDIRTPIKLIDREWWMRIATPELTSEQPTHGYYDAAWPNGKLYLYPEPSAASTVELLRRVVLAALGLDDAFTLPPGYQDLLTLSLAEDLSSPFRVALSPETQRKAEKARARVHGKHTRVPRITTHDAGMPGDGGSIWDYRTGM